MLPVESAAKERKRKCKKRTKEKEEEKKLPRKSSTLCDYFERVAFSFSIFLRCCSPVTVVYLPSDHLYFPLSFTLTRVRALLPSSLSNPLLLSFFTQFFVISHRLWLVVFVHRSRYTCRNFLRLKYRTAYEHKHSKRCTCT